MYVYVQFGSTVYFAHNQGRKTLPQVIFGINHDGYQLAAHYALYLCSKCRYAIFRLWRTTPHNFTGTGYII